MVVVTGFGRDRETRVVVIPLTWAASAASSSFPGVALGALGRTGLFAIWATGATAKRRPGGTAKIAGFEGLTAQKASGDYQA